MNMNLAIVPTVLPPVHLLSLGSKTENAYAESWKFDG